MHAAADVVSQIGQSVGWTNIGATGFVSLIIWLILTGRLVAGKERDYWRKMALELNAQNGLLIRGGETTVKIARAVQPPETEAN